MSPATWRLRPRILTTLRTEAGLTPDDLARRLGTTWLEIRPLLAVMRRQRLIDWAWGYVVAAPGHPADRKTV